MVARPAMKPEYSPREFGERLNPPRSGQWVLVRVQGKVPGEEIRARRKGMCWLVPHEELRRLTGQDLSIPGHEGVSSERADRELLRLFAEAQRVAIEQARILAEISLILVDGDGGRSKLEQ